MHWDNSIRRGALTFHLEPDCWDCLDGSHRAVLVTLLKQLYMFSFVWANIWPRSLATWHVDVANAHSGI